MGTFCVAAQAMGSMWVRYLIRQPLSALNMGFDLKISDSIEITYIVRNQVKCFIEYVTM